VLGSRETDNAAVRFDGADVPASQPLATYIASGWVEGLDPTSIRMTTVNGLQAATARASADQWDFDITVIRAGGSVYRLLTAMPRGSVQLGQLAQEVRGSFRRLSSAEKRALKPLTLQVVKAGPGQTEQSLATRMRGVSRPRELFRVLNGLEGNQTVVTGQSYKIVVD